MNYVLKAGVLYEPQHWQIVARLKSGFIGSEKKVLSADGTLLLSTSIQNPDVSSGEMNTMPFRKYIMRDDADNVCASARPVYAEGDDPTKVGWPICRMPKVDRAELFLDGQKYTVTMHSFQSYTVKEASGKTVVRVLHKGLAGGWEIEAKDAFEPQIICGIFSFCRYIEQENEFLIV